MERRDLGRIPPDTAPSEEHERRWLCHEADKVFGFSLWTRVAARFLVIDLLGMGALKWFGADAVEKWTVLDRMKRSEKSESRVCEAAERASRTLLALDTILSDELLLDHRMARPDARSLQPMVDLFAWHGDHVVRAVKAEDGRVRFLLSHATLWTMLHPYLNLTEMLALSEAIAKGKTLTGALRGYLRGLHKIWRPEDKPPNSQSAPDAELVREVVECAAAAFRQQVGKAQTLRHRAVGFLYALERRARQAREFNWEQTAFHGPSRRNDPLPLQARWLELPKGVTLRDLHPEKQHVVPHCHAAKIVGKKGSHATSSPANDIGNLTWLSARQNGFKGFSEKWMEVSIEADAKNFEARGFGDGEPGSAIEIYGRLRKRWHEGGRSDPRSLESLYAKFVEQRREWMVQKMGDWLGEATSGDRWARELNALEACP